MDRDLVVDTDTTDLNDDALALHYLVGEGRPPGLITTVFGNATAQSSARSARKVADALGLDVPVHPGAERPLRWNGQDRQNLRQVVQAMPAEVYLASLHPENTAFWTDVPEDGPAAAELAALLSSSAACDVLALGPATTIARAVQVLDPSVLCRHRLYFSGGALGTGNTSAAAEFNAFADPEALGVCLKADWERVTIVPLDVTAAPRLGPVEVDRIRRAPTPLGKALDELESRSPRGNSRDREPIWDVVTAVVLTGAVPVTVSRGWLTVYADPARRGVTALTSHPAVHDVVIAADADMIIRRFEEAVS